MKRTKEIMNNFKINNQISHIFKLKNIIKFLILFLSIVSIFIGAILYKLNYKIDILNLIQFNLKNNVFYNFKYTCLFLLKIDFIFMFCNLFFGLSFLGASFSVIPPIIKCILIGYTSSFFYINYKLKGVLFCLIFIYPYMAITTSSLIILSYESIVTSQYIYNVLMKKSTADNISLKLYFIKYAILIIINLLCTFINSGIISMFLPKINII